jgi:calcineurin-like phosphoesterase family protein
MTRQVQGKELFTVGIIADTHVNEAEDFSASPYPANALANARARAAFAEIDSSNPAFIMHLGDMVNPVPALPTYLQSAQNFHEIAGNLKAPLHLLAGNHDVGDKPVSWMPAGQVDDATLALYQSAFGAHYYSFGHNDILFVVINASIINSGLTAEQEQKTWLEDLFDSNVGRRCFVFIHYPLFITREDEPGSYDNIDEPGRSWLLNLLRKFKPEALFSAHVHNFWYNVVGETEIYTLPSTCFVRHDYSEMYRIGPGDQNGRNDTAKLGHALLTIFEHGHVLDITRSYGRERAATDEPAAIGAIRQDSVHTKKVKFDRVGLDMRQPWAEVVEITPSGGIDEFERKKARNDYPLLAIWEMGLRRLRIPVQDLLDPGIRRRIEIMKEVGHLFHVYIYELPDPETRAILTTHADLVSTLEIVLPWGGSEMDLSQLDALRQDSGIRIYLSRVNRKDAAKHEGGRYNHLISHGFSFGEAKELEMMSSTNVNGDAVSGFMLSVPNSQSPAEAVAQAAELAYRTARRICLYLRTTGANPAENHFDDKANLARITEAIIACAEVGNVEIILDTFADIDRGYFARSGLVDRRYNPKAGSRAVSALIGRRAGQP